MKYFRFLLPTVLLAGVLSAVSAGRQAAPAAQNDNGQLPSIVVNVDRVNILFTVKDNKGQLITSLKQEDFKVYEDDKPQVIERLNIDRDLPLNVAMLMDRSNTVLDQLKLEKDTAIEFLNKTLKHGKDKAVVIGFDTDVDDLSHGFTDDIEKLSEPIRKIIAGGSTAFFDAAYVATSQYLSKQPQRRMIVLISDGQDNSSRKTQDETLQLIQRSEVVVYAINPSVPGSTSGNDPRDRDRGDKALRRFADETGGRAYFPKRLEDLETGFQSIGEEVRSQYSLIYSPTNKARDGSFRRYKVVPNNKQYKVTMRTGYYAQAR